MPCLPRPPHDRPRSARARARGKRAQRAPGYPRETQPGHMEVLDEDRGARRRTEQFEAAGCDDQEHRV